MMFRQLLRSSFIASAGYDADTREMELEFVHGGTYSYPNVPPEVFEALVAADSPGKYFHQNIKGVYG